VTVLVDPRTNDGDLYTSVVGSLVPDTNLRLPKELDECDIGTVIAPS
jgi:hypothetical protein